MTSENEQFYLRYYSGHLGRHGHEFLEFDFRVLNDGRSATARYANNSNYRNDSLIRKESTSSPSPILALFTSILMGNRSVCQWVDDQGDQAHHQGQRDHEVRPRPNFAAPRADGSCREDDSKWPTKNKDGRQELEIRLGNEHISFETAKIGSLVDVQESADPEGLRVFYYLVQDLKALVFSLISLHFKIKPI